MLKSQTVGKIMLPIPQRAVATLYGIRKARNHFQSLLGLLCMTRLSYMGVGGLFHIDIRSMRYLYE